MKGEGEPIPGYKNSLHKQKPHKNPSEETKSLKDKKHQPTKQDFADKYTKFLETKPSGNESALVRNFMRNANGNESAQKRDFDRKVARH